MHEPDENETAFPPLPPPPPMTAEQRAQAEASIQAALAHEAERHARRMEMEECREKAALPTIDLPENKPRKPDLHAAGYHLSRSVVEDMIFDACLEAKIHSLEDVNHFLLAHECRPFVPQD